VKLLPSALSVAAAALAAVAAVVATQDGDTDIAPFFIGLTLAGGLHAWATASPLVGGRRWLAWLIAAAWLLSAIWIGVLLGMWQVMCACSYPPRPPEQTYLGFTATVYHLVGLYGGLALVAAATLLAERRRRAAGTGEVSARRWV
jgi:hypothetical protein